VIPVGEAVGTVQILDRIFRSRSHVRVLRALLTSDPSVNLTARAVGVAANISHVQASRTLFELQRAGIVTMEKVQGYSLCRLHDDHMLMPMILNLFEEELHILEKVHELVRQAASAHGWVARVSVDPGIDVDWEVSLVTRRQVDWADERWLRGLEDDL
jgi:hypothetical protein